MMAGTLYWNLYMAVTGFLVTFLVSLSSNLWQTSVIRGAVSFFLFFLIGFILRWIWWYILIKQEDSKEAEESPEVEPGKQKMAEDTAKETSKVIKSLLGEDNNQ
ncbi:hypothetical protein LCL89_04485 [Halobacillus yeomjeoni]|uniref:hypothetical protein n=1 Tax=Halobacillus yeomjeoni TaxID=311194 RepID=UPI001CD52C5D|nr:hypothetical protein [Halobacillus yeomjeoni]MCA0983305.1 hypothetical protein [Halobacillus yeomjeoni]